MLAILGILIVFTVLIAIVIAVYLLVSLLLKKLIHRKRARVLISTVLAVLLSAIGITYILSKALSDPKPPIEEDWMSDKSRTFFRDKSLHGDTLLGMTREKVINLIGLPVDTLDDEYIYNNGPHEGVALKFNDGRVLELHQTGR